VFYTLIELLAMIYIKILLLLITLIIRLIFHAFKSYVLVRR